MQVWWRKTHSSEDKSSEKADFTFFKDDDLENEVTQQKQVGVFLCPINPSFGGFPSVSSGNCPILKQKCKEETICFVFVCFISLRPSQQFFS